MFINEIDKIGVIITNDNYSYTGYKNNYCNNKHITTKRDFGTLYLTITSKVVKQFNKLGYISANNIQNYYEETIKNSSYSFSFETLLNSPLYWLDVKKDVCNTTGFSNQEVISVLREKSYLSTTKNETPSFAKDRGYEDSLLIKSTTKSSNDSMVIYCKIKEIRQNKWNDSDYYANFSEDWLLENENILRFERRLQKSEDIKKAFKLNHLKKVTLLDVFDSDVDVVKEYVKTNLMKGERYEKENRN